MSVLGCVSSPVLGVARKVAKGKEIDSHNNRIEVLHRVSTYILCQCFLAANMKKRRSL